MNQKLVTATILGAISLLCEIIGLATPAWQLFFNGTIGLFQGCSRAACVTLSQTSTAEKVGAAFTILAMLVMLAALTLLVMSILEKGKFQKIAGILFFIAALFMVIAVASYIGIWVSRLQSISIGYSAGLVIFSATLAVSAGITSIKSA